jgi:hypothetical protein
MKKTNYRYGGKPKKYFLGGVASKGAGLLGYGIDKAFGGDGATGEQIGQMAGGVGAAAFGDFTGVPGAVHGASGLIEDNFKYGGVPKYNLGGMAEPAQVEGEEVQLHQGGGITQFDEPQHEQMPDDFANTVVEPGDYILSDDPSMKLTQQVVGQLGLSGDYVGLTPAKAFEEETEALQKRIDSLEDKLDRESLNTKDILLERIESKKQQFIEANEMLKPIEEEPIGLDNAPGMMPDMGSQDMGMEAPMGMEEGMPQEMPQEMPMFKKGGYGRSLKKYTLGGLTTGQMGAINQYFDAGETTLPEFVGNDAFNTAVKNAPHRYKSGKGFGTNTNTPPPPSASGMNDFYDPFKTAGLSTDTVVGGLTPKETSTSPPPPPPDTPDYEKAAYWGSQGLPIAYNAIQAMRPGDYYNPNEYMLPRRDIDRRPVFNSLKRQQDASRTLTQRAARQMGAGSMAAMTSGAATRDAEFAGQSGRLTMEMDELDDSRRRQIEQINMSQRLGLEDRNRQIDARKQLFGATAAGQAQQIGAVAMKDYNMNQREAEYLERLKKAKTREEYDAVLAAIEKLREQRYTTPKL